MRLAELERERERIFNLNLSFNERVNRWEAFLFPIAEKALKEGFSTKTIVEVVHSDHPIRGSECWTNVHHRAIYPDGSMSNNLYSKKIEALAYAWAISNSAWTKEEG